MYMVRSYVKDRPPSLILHADTNLLIHKFIFTPFFYILHHTECENTNGISYGSSSPPPSSNMLLSQVHCNAL